MTLPDYGKPIPIGLIPVVDITRPITVTIDEVDRENHCFKHPLKCVIANALNRVPGITNAQVGADIVYFSKGNVPVRGMLPANMKAMIRAYDNDHQVMPAGIKVTIVPPIASKRLGAGRPTSKVPKAMQSKTGRARLSRKASRDIHVIPDDNGS